MLATAATQFGLATTQSWSQLLAIDQDAPISHDLGKEGRLGLGVFKLHDVHRTTDEPRELGDEIDDDSCVHNQGFSLSSRLRR
jgi:hypothetical protein